jgi:4-alpha-glucanotransferase
VDGVSYELAANHWASGVVSPTGYRMLESFTTSPVPTWVYNIGGHYLIKQIALRHGTNEVRIGYFWVPDQDDVPTEASITVRFLSAFRDTDQQVKGYVDKRYEQSIGADGASTVVTLDKAYSKLHLSWNRGAYSPTEEWWWGFHWPEEANRGLPDSEDLFLIGELQAELDATRELTVCASLDRAAEEVSVKSLVEATMKRERDLIVKAALPRGQDTNQLILACDQFLVKRRAGNFDGLTIVAGYQWSMDFGRDVMISLPGILLATRRFEEAKTVLATHSRYLSDGLIPSRFPDDTERPEYQSADATLWWAYALHAYYAATGDKAFITEQFPLLCQAADAHIKGTKHGIKVDPSDGLLSCGETGFELTWMDTRVAEIPITPRSGKPVEVCALWYNMLRVIEFFAQELGQEFPYSNLAELAEKSMQKFWNGDLQCLYDVLEPRNRASEKPDDAVRPNQVIALSLPFRGLSNLQEKAILRVVDDELLTPVGLRTLSPQHRSYQGKYGCGLNRPDQYHRDLSYHQGTVWAWLLGPYCQALLNVFGPLPETYAKIKILMQPLVTHLMEEGCLCSISEIFDGNAPHVPHASPAKAWSVGETMRMIALCLRNQ